MRAQVSQVQWRLSRDLAGRSVTRKVLQTAALVDRIAQASTGRSRLETLAELARSSRTSCSMHHDHRAVNARCIANTEGFRSACMHTGGASRGEISRIFAKGCSTTARGRSYVLARALQSYYILGLWRLIVARPAPTLIGAHVGATWLACAAGVRVMLQCIAGGFLGGPDRSETRRPTGAMQYEVYRVSSTGR